MPKCLACKRATQPPTLPYDFSSDEDDELSDVESSDEEEEGAWYVRKISPDSGRFVAFARWSGHTRCRHSAAASAALAAAPASPSDDDIARAEERTVADDATAADVALVLVLAAVAV